MNADYILPKGTTLFRYDLKEPPADWTIKWNLYVFVCDNEKKRKNELEAFFFFDNEAHAINVGSNSMPKPDKLWITQTETTSQLRLLDLNIPPACSSQSIVTGLYFLFKRGFDLFNDEFSFYTDESFHKKSFKEIRENFFNWLKYREQMNSTLPKERNEAAWRVLEETDKIDEFFCNRPINSFYQILTDFENGKIFKHMLVEKKYDGCIFNEDTDESHTYCIFDSCNLSKPQKKECRCI